MKRLINRIVLTATALFAVAGTTKAQLDLQNNLTGATVNWYISSSVPTADNPGTAATPGTTKINVGEYVVVKVTPTSGHWTYDGAITFQVAGGIGGGEAPHRALKLPVNPTALSSNQADGTGYYYYKIPDDCTPENGYKKVIFAGEVFENIDLSGASIDGTGKIVTATTGGWTATITLDPVSWTYDGSAHVPSISSFTLSNGTKTFTNTADQVSISGSGTNAGNYNATLSSVDNGCLKISKQVPFSISKKAITLTSGSKTREYNGTALTNSEVEGKNANGLTMETGWVDGEGATYSFTGSQTTEGESDNAFSYEAKSGTLLANYTITKTEGKLTVTKNTTVITVKPASGSKVYDGTPLTKTAHEDFTVTGVPDGFTWTATADGTVTNVTPGAGEKAVNAVTSFIIFKGTADVTNQFSDITTSATGTLSITQREITASVADKNATYNGTEQSGNSEVSFSNVVAGQTATISYTPAKGTMVATYDNGSYGTDLKVMSGTTDVTANYNLTTKTAGKLIIGNASKAITITAASQSWTYDGNLHTNTTVTVTSGTLFDGDVLVATATGGVTNVSDNIPDNNPIAEGYKVMHSDVDVTANYTITPVAGTLTINQKEVGLNWTNTHLTFNGTEQVPTCEATGLVNGDEVSVTVTVAGEHSAVGNYTATASALTGTKSGNYKLPADNTHSFSIDEAGMAGIVATGFNNTYDGTAHGINVTIPDGATVKFGETEGTYDLNTSPQYTDVCNKTVYYKVTKEGFSAVTGSAKVIITKADLTITAKDKTITYGDVPTNDGVTYSGFVGTDDASVLDGTLGYDYNYTQYGNVGDNYSITPKNLTSTNYNITFTAGKLTVNQKEVGLNWTNTHLTFNGTEQVPTCEATGLVNGDEVSVTVTVAGEHSAVGNYTATASALTGTKSGNYKLPADNTHSFSIDEAGMAGIVATGFNNTYDGTAHGINVTIPDGATVKFGETEGTYDLNTSPEYTDVCNKTVYYKVTKAGFSDVTGSAKVVITQKEVGLNWTNTSLVFDGTPQEPHCTAVGLMNDDEVSVTVTVAGEHTAVGNYIATASALTGAKAGNYKLPDANTQAFSISAVLTTIRVVRNDTGEDVPNVVATTESIDGEGHEIWTIDRVNITAPADASANKLVSVSVYIPATIKAGAEDKVLYGVGSDILVTSAYVPVTDIYMPETDEIIDVQANAFRLNATASVTARIHTPLALLDDYALNAGLKDEYEDGHVMSTVSPTTHYWTLSSGVDVVVPNGVTAYTCQADGTSAVAAIAITNTTAMVEETERVIIKANNGVLMGNQSGTGGTYDLVAWPSADRPSGTAPTTIDAKTYDGNLMEPALVRTHFAPNDYYILYNNTFHELKPTDDTFVSPCKAVLRKNSSVMASKLRINVGSDTGINELVNSEESVDDWYTLDGVKLNSKPTQKGVYINGGKKVFMK